jgi:hypothetical protein
MKNLGKSVEAVLTIFLFVYVLGAIMVNGLQFLMNWGWIRDNPLVMNELRAYLAWKISCCGAGLFFVTKMNK